MVSTRGRREVEELTIGGRVGWDSGDGDVTTHGCSPEGSGIVLQGGLLLCLLTGEEWAKTSSYGSVLPALYTDITIPPPLDRFANPSLTLRAEA